MTSRRRRGVGAALLLALLAIAVPPATAGALAEPTEKDLRAAFVGYLEDFILTQGEVVDPYCRLTEKGCSVKLLDMRRDFRLASFAKRWCRSMKGPGFVCSFQAKVVCDYFSGGKPQPEVAELYCGPLYNKTSTYTAEVEYVDSTWVLVRFVQG